MAGDKMTHFIIGGRELCWILITAGVVGFLIGRWIP